MARPASLDESPWLPAYGWWPPPSDYDVTAILTPYHSAIEPEARFRFVLRGYAGSPEPVWEHDVGILPLGRQRGIRLDAISVPPPPEPEGGVLEVHAVRLDRQPKGTIGFNGMWIDAVGRRGGGYVIPTIPIRGQRKVVKRDDLQVIPGVIASREVETELVLLNVIDEQVEVRLVVSTPDGLVTETDRFEVGPWSAWRGDLSDEIPRLRRMLLDSDGVGSLSIFSNHRLLPYFGFRKGGNPVVSMDHSAPIFASA